MHLEARLFKEIPFEEGVQNGMENGKMRLGDGEWDSRSGRYTKRRRSKTIHQMYKKRNEKNKVFSHFSFFSHSLIYSTMFFHPFSQQTKKERTHKTPIHKIKPIPSLS